MLFRSIAKSAPDDWKLTDLGWIFSIAIFFLGASAAVFGRWVEEGGPRRTMFTAALCFGGGFLVGYLAYDMLHYHVHHHKPRTALGHKLRELHMRHHFQDDERGFGISAPYWDRVFGTAPAEQGNRVVGQPSAPQDPSTAR